MTASSKGGISDCSSAVEKRRMRPLSESPLSDEDQRGLLERARKAIVEVVCHDRFPDLPPAVGRLAEPGGAFVTLRCNAGLRGCIGRTDAVHALAETVVQCAITAASHDLRFKPLRAEDMAGLEIEISVISELRRAMPGEIKLGVHGIEVTRGDNRGLLLPQVAVEPRWSTAEFLRAACRKARLEEDAWCSPDTKLFAFTAEVFSDVSLVATGEAAGDLNSPTAWSCGRSDQSGTESRRTVVGGQSGRPEIIRARRNHQGRSAFCSG